MVMVAIGADNVEDNGYPTPNHMLMHKWKRFLDQNWSEMGFFSLILMVKLIMEFPCLSSLSNEGNRLAIASQKRTVRIFTWKDRSSWDQEKMFLFELFLGSIFISRFMHCRLSGGKN